MRLLMLILLLTAPSFVSGQQMTWSNISQAYALPAGVALFSGESSSPALKAWYLDIDMNDTSIAVMPYLSNAAAGVEGVAPFCARVGAIAAINGGFFGGATSYSAVVYPEVVMVQNIAALNRSGLLYPVTRSFFGLTYGREMSVDWIYHFGSSVDDLYVFVEPAENAPGFPAPVPVRENGSPYGELMLGIGGGPTLIDEGEITITYDEEVFWDSGIGYETLNPRSAVGCTAEGHAILLVVDGRQAASQGVGLPALAQMMVDLGCVEAMNLDGGGSTQMAVGSVLINRPEGGTFMRPVPTILAVVDADSIPRPPIPPEETIIDTGDPACALVGLGWFPSANPGYWGGTPSMLNVRGSGEAYALFEPMLPGMGRYELYAWWVAAFNRCTDTPFIIYHRSGADTVCVDQTVRGSIWNLLGTFEFNGDSSDVVVLSNAAQHGTYVVADAIRFVLIDTTATFLDDSPSLHPVFVMPRSYPNPFNQSTTIEISLQRSSSVEIGIYDIRGRWVTTIAEGRHAPGRHCYRWHAGKAASGIYLCRVVTDSFIRTIKIAHVN